MLRALVFALPLCGMLLSAAPVAAAECAQIAQAVPETLPPDVAPEPLFPPPGSEGSPAWCDGSDDPRCMPGSHDARPLEMTVRLLLTAPDAPLPGAPGCAVPPTPAFEGLGPRAGIRNRVERPPRV